MMYVFRIVEQITILEAQFAQKMLRTVKGISDDIMFLEENRMFR